MENGFFSAENILYRYNDDGVKRIGDGRWYLEKRKRVFDIEPVITPPKGRVGIIGYKDIAPRGAGGVCLSEVVPGDCGVCGTDYKQEHKSSRK